MSQAMATRVDQLPVAPAASESAAILSVIERMAMNPEFDPARIERFIDLKERMEAKAAKTAYNAAYVLMQPELPAIEKKGVGNNNKAYGKWEDIQEGITPVLAKHGFGLTFKVDQSATNGDITVTAVLLHEGGHDESTPFVAKADKSGNKNDIQSIGSTIQYGKRYSASALLNIRVVGEDDDGRRSQVEGLGEKQLLDLNDLIEAAIEEVGGNAPKVFRPNLLKYLRVESLSDLPARDYAKVVAAINSARPKK